LRVNQGGKSRQTGGKGENEHSECWGKKCGGGFDLRESEQNLKRRGQVCQGGWREGGEGKQLLSVGEQILGMGTVNRCRKKKKKKGKNGGKMLD